MLSIVAFMAGALFASISSITGLILTYVRYFVWKNNLTEKWNLSKRKVLILSIIFLISLLIIFNLIVYFFSNNSSFWDDNEKNKWLWFDAIGASLEICAYTFLIFKVWWAFLFFFTSKFFLIQCMEWLKIMFH